MKACGMDEICLDYKGRNSEAPSSAVVLSWKGTARPPEELCQNTVGQGLLVRDSSYTKWGFRGT